MHRFPVFGFLLVSLDVILNEFQAIVARQVPEQLAEAAKRLAARLGTAKACSGIFQLKQDATPFVSEPP